MNNHGWSVRRIATPYPYYLAACTCGHRSEQRHDEDDAIADAMKHLADIRGTKTVEDELTEIAEQLGLYE